MFLHRFEVDTPFFPFTSLMTHSRDYLVWTIVSLFSYWSCPKLFHKVPFNVFLLFPSRYFTSLLSFESLLIHSHNYDVWAAAHVFFFHFLNVTVPFFFCNCYTKSLNSFLFLQVHTLLQIPSELSVRIIALCEFLRIVCSLCKWNYTFLFCVSISQVLCKAPPLPLSVPSVELFCSTIFDCHNKVIFFFSCVIYDPFSSSCSVDWCI